MAVTKTTPFTDIYILPEYLKRTEEELKALIAHGPAYFQVTGGYCGDRQGYYL